MTKKKEKAATPKLAAVDGAGKRRRIQAERIEVDFGAGRVLMLGFPADDPRSDLEIEAVAQNDTDTPIISLHAGACNVLNLKLDVRHDLFDVEDEAPKGKSGPVLSLNVQKALESADKGKAPKKHKIRRWAQAALRHSAAVTVRLVDEKEARALNRDYRKKDCATNVLTFVYDEQTEPLAGDLVLCVPVILREAAAQNKAPDAHFAHLVVHGMLHLQGFDHEKEQEAEIMENLEREIMKTLGFADPYA